MDTHICCWWVCTNSSTFFGGKKVLSIISLSLSHNTYTSQLQMPKVITGMILISFFKCLCAWSMFDNSCIYKKQFITIYTALIVCTDWERKGEGKGKWWRERMTEKTDFQNFLNLPTAHVTLRKLLTSLCLSCLIYKQG